MSHPDGPRTGRSTCYAPRGMIATSHALASVAGLQAMQRGGSAVDAAIAANAVLCVAYPHMAGLGGDGFWLIRDPGERRVLALNASGPAGRAATRDFYRELGHDEIPERGPLAALTVPGAVDGWRAAHERFGRLPWRELFGPAIRYAREGVPVGRSLSDWLALDVPVLQRHPETARIFLPGRAPLREGQRLVQAELADTLERLARDGARAGFYEGETAERIAAGLAAEGSPLTAEDFAAFHADWVEPITSTYRDYDVIEFPPNTQGFAALQILNLIEGFDVRAWRDGTADYYHHMAEAVKLAFADRDAWLTDPDAVEIPVDRLVSKAYAAERRRLIESACARVMEEVLPGIPYEPPPGPALQRAADGGRASARRQGRAGGDTIYLCAVDDERLVVSMIQSIYHDFGSAVAAGDTGVLIQNRGSFFSLDEDHPNVLEPGKRTFHTLIPAMMLRDGEPYLAFGSMGGEGQPQTHAALITRLVDFGYDVQQAIEAPRWLMGRTWGVESRDLSLEGRVPDETVRELTRRGQPIKMLPDWDDNMGHAQAIRIDSGTGFLEGGADPRGDGAALGW